MQPRAPLILPWCLTLPARVCAVYGFDEGSLLDVLKRGISHCFPGDFSTSATNEKQQSHYHLPRNHRAVPIGQGRTPHSPSLLCITVTSSDALCSPAGGISSFVHPRVNHNRGQLRYVTTVQRQQSADCCGQVHIRRGSASNTSLQSQQHARGPGFHEFVTHETR